MTPEERIMRDRVVDRSRRRDLFIAAWLQNPKNAEYGYPGTCKVAVDAVKMADLVLAIDDYASAHGGKIPKVHSGHGYTPPFCSDCKSPTDPWCSNSEWEAPEEPKELKSDQDEMFARK